jgi:putative ABC transport system ATP-binding protein
MHSLSRYKIDDCAHRTPDEISGGQAQRASVARALVSRPAIVFADEPTASLDAASRDDVLKALQTAVDAGTSVVCATHDPVLMSLADAHFELTDRSRDEYLAS